MRIDISDGFGDSLRARLAARGVPGAAAWVEGVPRVLDEAVRRWDLQVDGEAIVGECAVVVPVRRAGGRVAALKVAAPRPETAQDHLALRAWNGDGAVALLAADPASGTVLLERLDLGCDLHAVPEDEACAELGRLVARLDRPAPPQIVRVGPGHPVLDAVTTTTDPAVRALPRRFVQQASGVAEELVAGARAAGRADRLVHGALHVGNVLRGERGWTAIAPSAVACEPEFAVAPALWHRFEEMDDDLGWGVHSRLGWVCEAGGLDEDRARGWALVRTVAAGVDLARRGDDAGLTRCVALVKALAQRW